MTGVTTQGDVDESRVAGGCELIVEYRRYDI